MKNVMEMVTMKKKDSAIRHADSVSTQFANPMAFHSVKEYIYSSRSPLTS